MIESLVIEIPKFLDKLIDIPNESIAKEFVETKTSMNPLEYSLNTIETQSLESLKIENKYAADIKENTLNEIRTIRTRNENLAGKVHPETKIPFVEKVTVGVNGERIRGVYPVFESKFDAQLPKELYEATDKEQFRECIEQLKRIVENNPEEAEEIFTKEKLEDIKAGNTPDGFTWHHNEEIGKMQLVDTEKHSRTAHTAGKYIWGGGSQNR